MLSEFKRIKGSNYGLLKWLMDGLGKAVMKLWKTTSLKFNDSSQQALSTISL